MQHNRLLVEILGVGLSKKVPKDTSSVQSQSKVESRFQLAKYASGVRQVALSFSNNQVIQQYDPSRLGES